MHGSKVQHITSNDSRVIANAALKVADVDIAMTDFDASEFGSVQRKALLSWSREEEGVYYGAAVRGLKISEQALDIEVRVPGDVSIDLGPEELVLDSSLIACGRYVLSVDIYLDLPLKHFGEVPDHIKPLLKYSEIFHVIIRLRRASDLPLCIGMERNPVYNSYGQLGFFIADLEKMNAYIISRLGEGEVNLKDAFCETELANELFDEGLLILVWGMTPTAYYVYGLDCADDRRLVPSVAQPQFTGTYKFRSDVQQPSVVPGECLLDWPACLNANFPTITLAGKCEWVSVDVHVMGYYYMGIGTGPNFPVITAYRDEESDAAQPLLMVDMAYVEPQLCF